MRKVFCAPPELIPKSRDQVTKYFSMYSKSKEQGVGVIGTSIVKLIGKLGLRPTEAEWDFNTIALCVAAADKCLDRKKSYDGWTRDIELTIYLSNPSVWAPVVKKLEQTLNFISGDFWFISLENGGTAPPAYSESIKGKGFDMDFNCISLLSGGVDSLVGAIDIIKNGNKPIFVSQVSRGNSESQKTFAKKIGPGSYHIQLNSNIRKPDKETEPSTRARSICFFGFAALAASALNPDSRGLAKLIIPENGFISLNISLTPGRIGSYSTKTTHPIYLSGIQQIWDAVGINVKLEMPYKFKTKGEMLVECRGQEILKDLIGDSVSCGKYGVYKLSHCGRCLPCLVRRAAFLRWNETDNTVKSYFDDNLERIKHGNPDDVGAVLIALRKQQMEGNESLILGELHFSEKNDRENFKAVYIRGLKELRGLLSSKGLI